MEYLFKGKVVTGETMQEVAEVEKFFRARDDQEAREICKKDLSLQFVLVNEKAYRLFKEIPIEIIDHGYGH